MRLFVALEIPAAVRDNLAALLADLRRADSMPRWVRAENLHVTLKFIGETPPDKQNAIRDVLAGVRSDSPAELSFRGLGFFPNEKRPRVLWAGVEASANVNSLAAEIDRSLETLGFPRERHLFTPHLTMARFNSPRLAEKLRAAIQQNIAHEFGSFRTSEFHLIQSKLKPSGAEYTRLASFQIAAAV